MFKYNNGVFKEYPDKLHKFDLWDNYNLID
jgi:hypothetical protein